MNEWQLFKLSIVWTLVFYVLGLLYEPLGYIALIGAAYTMYIILKGVVYAWIINPDWKAIWKRIKFW